MNTLPTPLATSPLSTWLDYLEQLHSKTIDLGLDRVRRVAQRLGLLTPAPVVYTVAGTNGKGTTCRTLEAILMAAGYRVGVYGSPHLLHYRERVRIQHRELDDAAHAAAFAAVEAGRDGVSLTYFEFGTLAALYLFKQAALDAVILEVGLGGRLDATNIVDPSVAVVTSIALDHTDWLGDTRESIGREKAGIFRGAAPAVVGEPDMPDSIGAVAQACGAHLLRRGVDWDFSVEAQEWRWRDAHRHIEGLPLPQVPLANAATALAALCYGPLPVDDAAIRQGLRDAVLPGRFQQLSEAPRLILDVAHNPHAAAYLAQRLRALPARGRLRMVIGMLSDKDIAGTLACLTPLVDQWYCAPLPADAQAFDGVEQAWRQAMADAATDDTVVVCGSFHTVAHVMAALASGETGGK
ncbi:MAG: bifunctional tetrahydrofolate synthase/dihydrofolate synthase [Edwardsiella sp. (in: enterobacteria)]